MKAEYIACSTAVQEAMWLKRFVEDLEINISVTTPVTIYCDSQITIPFSKDVNTTASRNILRLHTIL